MFGKRRLITAVVLIVATITIVIAVATVAGIFFLRGSNNTEAMSGATAVGVPNGPATTKSIGPAGGSIASPDGRIVVDVPPNALAGPIDFSIQPITNLAHGGVGNAYRLEPSGQKFAPPIEVSFKFDAQDLKGYSPEALVIAYQDPTGVWQSFRTVNIDQASKTLTVSTTHFTDLSVWTIRLSPEKATLRLRETQYIELVGCRRERSMLTRLRRLFGRGDQQPCYSTNANKPSWSANLGTIVPAGTGAMYTAPAKKPSPNVDMVYLTYIDESQGGRSIGVFSSEITIVDRGYRASGKIFDTVLSGDICDLEKPFTIKTNNPFNTDFECVPSSPTEGTCAVTEKNGISGGGGGPYTIKGTDTDKPRIELNFSGKATIKGAGTSTGGGPIRIDLVPLDTECKP